MNYADWYTDRMTIRRVRAYQDGALTRQERVTVEEDVPCRIYRSGVRGPRMLPTAAYAESADDKLACGNYVDVRAGDELLICRGKGLGQVHRPIRAFAGEPLYYHEPFGAVMPGLAHQQIALLQKEYLDAEVTEDGAG